MVIYLIRNLINGKKYIGQTTKNNPKKRWASHKCSSNKESPDSYIHRAMRKYGIDNFTFEVIDESATNLDELNDLEELYISMYDTFKGHGYNMTSGGESYEVSEETKKKISDALMGRTFSEEHRKNISKSQMGNKHHLYGKFHSEETKQKMSESSLGKKNPNYGKKASKETIKKMSDAQRGKTHSEESKKKMSSVRLGTKFSEEHKKKLSDVKLSILNIRSRKIIQLDKITGDEFICWFSMGDVQRELGIFVSAISACCSGKYKSAGGFKWKYLNP